MIYPCGEEKENSKEINDNINVNGKKYCSGDGKSDGKIVNENGYGSTSGGKIGSGGASRITSGRNDENVSDAYRKVVTVAKNKIN